MSIQRTNWTNVLLVIVGVLLLGVWLSFIDRAVRHPFPFIVALLAIILLVTRKWSNLVFHMVGILLFACLLWYVQDLEKYPLRFAVIGLAVILMTTRNFITENRSTSFSSEYKKIKERREQRERDRQNNEK